MANAFANIAFTANVKALQTRMGSREAYARREQEAVEEPVLGPREIAFIEARDSFYLGTVSETGWPYVQHRGGPAGFLKVLGARTIGYADFSGNRQYVSAGNLAGDDRVSLFLMDYPHQARLKILGRARVIDESSDPGLLARLDNPHYRARVERGIVIHIEGFDWNCPKYITPRYTEDEVEQRIKAATSALAPHALQRNA
jgi:predicted pyridoxine 5'-phosphate oxidase superfamily flavin-nucleotide-binding protein